MTTFQESGDWSPLWFRLLMMVRITSINSPTFPTKNNDDSKNNVDDKHDSISGAIRNSGRHHQVKIPVNHSIDRADDIRTEWWLHWGEWWWLYPLPFCHNSSAPGWDPTKVVVTDVTFYWTVRRMWRPWLDSKTMVPSICWWKVSRKPWILLSLPKSSCRLYLSPIVGIVQTDFILSLSVLSSRVFYI